MPKAEIESAEGADMANEDLRAQLADVRTEANLLRDRLEKWQRNYTRMKDRAYAAEAKLAEVERAYAEGNR